MARTPKSIVTAQLATTALTTIYTVPAGINASAVVLTFTNATTTANTISVFHGTGTDFLQEIVTIPAGVGRRRVFNMHSVVNATETVKIQASASTAVNYSLSASEVET